MFVGRAGERVEQVAGRLVPGLTGEQVVVPAGRLVDFAAGMVQVGQGRGRGQVAVVQFEHAAVAGDGLATVAAVPVAAGQVEQAVGLLRGEFQHPAVGNDGGRGVAEPLLGERQVEEGAGVSRGVLRAKDKGVPGLGKSAQTETGQAKVVMQDGRCGQEVEQQPAGIAGLGEPFRRQVVAGHGKEPVEVITGEAGAFVGHGGVLPAGWCGSRKRVGAAGRLPPDQHTSFSRDRTKKQAGADSTAGRRRGFPAKKMREGYRRPGYSGRTKKMAAVPNHGRGLFRRRPGPGGGTVSQ